MCANACGQCTGHGDVFFFPRQWTRLKGVLKHGTSLIPVAGSKVLGSFVCRLEKLGEKLGKSLGNYLATVPHRQRRAVCC